MGGGAEEPGSLGIRSLYTLEIKCLQSSRCSLRLGEVSVAHRSINWTGQAGPCKFLVEMVPVDPYRLSSIIQAHDYDVTNTDSFIIFSFIGQGTGILHRWKGNRGLDGILQP